MSFEENLELQRKLREIAMSALDNSLAVMECKDKEGNMLSILCHKNGMSPPVPLAIMDEHLIDRLADPENGAHIMEAKFQPSPREMLEQARSIITAHSSLDMQPDMGFVSNKKRLVS